MASRCHAFADADALRHYAATMICRRRHFLIAMPIFFAAFA